MFPILENKALQKIIKISFVAKKPNPQDCSSVINYFTASKAVFVVIVTSDTNWPQFCAIYITNNLDQAIWQSCLGPGRDNLRCLWGWGGSWPLFQGQLGRKQIKSFYVTQILHIFSTNRPIFLLLHNLMRCWAPSPTLGPLTYPGPPHLPWARDNRPVCPTPHRRAWSRLFSSITTSPFTKWTVKLWYHRKQIASFISISPYQDNCKMKA